MTEVRIATPADESSLMSLLAEMAEENAMGAIDPDRVRTTLRRGILRDHALVGVIRGQKDIEASIGLFAGQFWYGKSQHLEDLWNYVREPYRRSDNAKLLLQFASMASKALDRPLLMSVINTEQTAPKVRLYKRVFGEPAGAMFLVNGATRSPVVALT